MGKHIGHSILLLFLIFDTGYSFLQHYHMPFDGDMPACILPSEETRPVLDHPLGLRAITEGERYANPNRFFSHWTMYQYFNQVPLWWHAFLSPLDSAYFSSALFKTLVQLIILLVLAVAVTGHLRLWSTLLAATLLIPLFQTNGYFDYMGIIDRSATYTFFYAFPMALLLLYCLPLLLQQYHRRSLKGFRYLKILWIPLALVCCLSSPIIPGVALVASALLFGRKWLIQYRSGTDFAATRDAMLKMPANYYYLLLPLFFFSLYSLWLGSYNSANLEHPMSLSDLYAKLPLGLYYQFTQKLGWPVLFLVLLINTLLIRFRYGDQEEGRKILSTFKWIGLFALLYILLLPLGGYRSYRPYVLRYDTIMPITLALFFVYGQSTLFLLRHLSRRQKRWYLPVLLLILLIFTNADEPGFANNSCEKAAITNIANAQDEVVRVTDQCTILSWTLITDPANSLPQVRLLRRWRVIGAEDRLFYQ